MNEYLCEKMNSLTAWLGVIGLILLICHMFSWLFLLFVLQILVPDTKFSQLFKSVSNFIKKEVNHHHD